MKLIVTNTHNGEVAARYDNLSLAMALLMLCWLLRFREKKDFRIKEIGSTSHSVIACPLLLSVSGSQDSPHMEDRGDVFDYAFHAGSSPEDNDLYGILYDVLVAHATRLAQQRAFPSLSREVMAAII